MKKILKISGIILTTVILLIAISGFVLHRKGIPSYEMALPEVNISATPAMIERGQKLTEMLCAGCHLNSQTGSLTGTIMKDAPPEFGTIYAPNITQDKEHGIGTWSDAHLVRLLRTGIKKDGKYAPPYMAKLPLMADSDIEAIISFLRSDHKLVLPNPTPDKPSEPSILTKLLCQIAWKPFPLPSKRIELPDSQNILALGEYLAHNLDCFSCHSADFKTNNFLDPAASPGYFGGGNKVLNQEGEIILTSNLTPDKQTGIGDWTKEEFIQVLKTGIKTGEPALSYPMQPYLKLTNHEAGAIYEYLRTIPAIENKIERNYPH